MHLSQFMNGIPMVKRSMSSFSSFTKLWNIIAQRMMDIVKRQRLVCCIPTQFGTARVFDMNDEEGKEVRILEVDGYWQSASYLDEPQHLAFPYHRLLDYVFDAPHAVRRMLVLGGGACSYPAHVRSLYPDIRIDVVEVDESICDIARRYFGIAELENSKAELSGFYLHSCDACELIAQPESFAVPQHGDVVIIDCFCGGAADTAILSEQGLKAAHDYVGSRGIVAINVVSALSGPESEPLRTVAHTLEHIFSQVFIVPLGADNPLVCDNNLVFASDAQPFIAGAWKLSDLPAL